MRVFRCPVQVSEHTLAGKGNRRVCPVLHQPSGLNTHFPMQHHSLTVNTAWKTANAIFSNGCYEEGEIVASRKTGSGVDRQYSPVTGSAPCQDAAAVCCWIRGKKNK